MKCTTSAKVNGYYIFTKSPTC